MSARAASLLACRLADVPKKCGNLLTDLSTILAEMLFAREEARARHCPQIAERHREIRLCAC